MTLPRVITRVAQEMCRLYWRSREPPGALVDARSTRLRHGRNRDVLLRLRDEHAAEHRLELLRARPPPGRARVRLHHRDPRDPGVPADLPDRALLPGLAPAPHRRRALPARGRLRLLRHGDFVLD